MLPRLQAVVHKHCTPLLPVRPDRLDGADAAPDVTDVDARNARRSARRCLRRRDASIGPSALGGCGLLREQWAGSVLDFPHGEASSWP